MNALNNFDVLNEYFDKVHTKFFKCMETLLSEPIVIEIECLIF